MDPRLTNTPPAAKIAALGAFAADVRRGRFSNGSGVRVQTVQVALRAIGTTCELDGCPNPCYQANQQSYLKPIQRIITAYTNDDPPSQSKLAVPIHILDCIYNDTLKYPTPKKVLIANLCNVAFFYLLRSAEYTHTGKSTQTQRLCLGDVTFWKGNTVIPSWAPPKQIIQATAATLTFRNQKNGIKGQTVHQEATYTHLCPVQALIRIVSYIKTYTDDAHTPLCTYWNNKHEPRYVHATDITIALRNGAKLLRLEQQGINLAQISSHSLRAGGAMALHLAGVPAHTIRLLGRWQSDAFLHYLHTQLSCFTKGLSSLMSTAHTFTNVARTPSTKL